MVRTLTVRTLTVMTLTVRTVTVPADTDLLISQSQLGGEFLPVLGEPGGEVAAVGVGDESARGGLSLLQPRLVGDGVPHLVHVHLDRRESGRGETRTPSLGGRSGIVEQGQD